MPIRPTGAVLYFPSLGISLIADSVKYKAESELWKRSEFEHERQRQVKNTDGSKPIFIELFGGRLIQYMTTCGVNTVRPVTPDDSDIDNILKKWFKKQYTITGTVSLDSFVEVLYHTSEDHRFLLDRVQAHLEEASLDVSFADLLTLQAETFSFVQSTGLTMYGDPISPNTYLTSPATPGTTVLPVNNGLGFVAGQTALINNSETKAISGSSSNTVSVAAIAGTYSAGATVQLYETDLLITDFTPDVTRVIPTPTGFTVRKEWSLTLEHRVLKNARATA